MKTIKKFFESEITWNIIATIIGLLFVLYGVVKLLGGQFIHPPWKVTFDTSEPMMHMVWYFFGYSWMYTIFIAIGEMVSGTLFIFRKTRFMGAILLFPISLNITVMDFAFHFPSVKWLVLGYTTLIALYLLKERKRFLYFID